jgi:DNA repair exonuclease SbcCD nuclease subunit
VKIYYSSDWHGDASTSGLDRFDEVASAAHVVADAAIDARRTDEVFFVFGGDLCDPDTTRAFRAIALAIDIARKLSANGVPSLWIAGNHDTIENERGSTVLEPLAAMAEHHASDSAWIEVCEEPRDLCPGLGVEILVLPYVARARAYDPVDVVKKACPEDGHAHRVLVFGHLTVPSAERGSESDDFARGRDLVFPVEACRARWGDRAFLANAHYHRRQVTRDGVHIPGSLARLRHDEEQHEPGYLVIDV